MGKIHFARYLVLLAMTATACGCGEATPKTYPVSGTVTLDSKPVPGANVTFIEDGISNRAATTTTDAQGKYMMSTFKQGDGAVPGTYKVTVTKYQKGAEENPYGNNPPESVEQTPEAISEAYGKGYTGPPKGNQTKGPKEWNDVPDKYADMTKSGLTCTVEAKPSNTYDIELKSK